MRMALAAAFVAIAGCTTLPPAPTDEAAALQEARAGLAAFSSSWRRFYEAGDFDAMSDLYEADAWLMTRDQPARKGREAILDYFSESRRPGATAQIYFQAEDIVVDGDYAFQIALWWLESPEAIGEPVRDSGRSLVVFKRGGDGVWRLWRDIDNRSPDVAFPVPEEVLRE